MINTISPTTFTSSVLIGDEVQSPNGSSDSTPKMTVVNGQTVTAALEVRSTEGGFLPPRMTTAQRNEMVVDNGMMIYNITTNTYDIYVNGGWKVIASSSGALLPTVVDDIATFADTSGTIKDSGVSIAQVPPVLVNAAIASPGNNNTISNLSYVQFLSGSGYVFLADQAGIQLFQQPSPQNICTVITDGSIPPSPSSVSCAFEINTRFGALLLSRMSQSNMNSLSNPQDGMLLFNSDSKNLQIRQNGVWATVNTSGGGIVENLTIVTGHYDILLSDTVIMSNVPNFAPTLVLPSNPASGQSYRIFDYSGNAGTNSINIEGNGKTINGASTLPRNLGQVSVGTNPDSIAITSNNFVYCANIANSISVYHNVDTFLTTLSGGGLNSPSFMAVTPDSNYVYVVNSGSTGTNGITIVRNASSVSPTLSSLNTQNSPTSIAITANGVYAYVTNRASNSVSVFQNVSTNSPSLLTTLTGNNLNTPLAVAITPNGNRAYVINNGNPSINSVTCYQGVSTATPTFLSNLNIGLAGNTPNSLAISPDGNYLWVVSAPASIVTVFQNISSGTPSTLKQLNTGAGSSSVSFSPDGNYVYIVNSGSNNLNVYDNTNPADPVFLKFLTVGSGPSSITFSPDGYYAYVTVFSSGAGTTVSVIKEASLSTSSVLSPAITVGTGPRAAAVTTDGNYVYVANLNSNNMSIIGNASGYRAITTNYGSAALIYNGVQWNAVQSLAITG